MDLACSGGSFFPSNFQVIYDLRVIPIQKVTEDIAAIFLLLYSDANTAVYHDGVHDTRETDDDDFVMDNINGFEIFMISLKNYPVFHASSLSTGGSNV